MTPTSETFSSFDTADYLSTFEDVAAYLEAVIEEGDDDPAVIAQALGAIARSRNVSELARRAGMSREGLYKALSAEGNPSFATVLKVSRALGLRLHFESIAQSGGHWIRAALGATRFLPRCPGASRLPVDPGDGRAHQVRPRARLRRARGNSA
jgi:probable addiction module antidote protein